MHLHVLVFKLCLEGADIDRRGALSCAAFAAHAQVEHFAQLLGVKAIDRRGLRQDLTHHVGAAAGGISLVERRAVARTHRATGSAGLAAGACPVALLGHAQDASRVAEVEQGLDLRFGASGLIAQAFGHGVGVDHLAGIKNAERIEGLLDALEALVVRLAQHEGQVAGAHDAVAVLATE